MWIRDVRTTMIYTLVPNLRGEEARTLRWLAEAARGIYAYWGRCWREIPI
jgi:hypothetical protein